MVCAPAAVAMVWKWLYNTQFGLINNIFHTNIAWISDPKIAWISIGVIGVWSIIGYNMVLFIGGLQEIPETSTKAASIDGAGGVDSSSRSRFRCFHRLPSLSYRPVSSVR